jgi:radical SAM protein with 4Fe4S-binding SPASM domain
VAHDLDKLAMELPLRVRSGQQQDNPLQRKVPCYEAWMFCVIGPDGEVVPCCYCEEEVLGNVFDESFAKIWTNARYKDMRRRMLAMPKTGVPVCKECFTNCNRAVVNQKIYSRIHPLRKVAEPSPEAVTASNPT